MNQEPYYLFINCRGHVIRIDSFYELADAQHHAVFHSNNCGDSIMFEVWHKRECIERYVEGSVFCQTESN